MSRRKFRIIFVGVISLGGFILLNSGFLATQCMNDVKEDIPKQNAKDAKDVNSENNDAMHQRMSYIKTRCSALSKTDYWKKSHPSGYLYSFDDVTFCNVPKVACTFWISVIRFVGGDYEVKDRPILKPSDIDRYQVHNGMITNLTYTQINSSVGRLLMSTTKSFMFTRHPFTRLWSAYIDKFFLPEFWGHHARDVARVIRQIEHSCVSDISFEEFLDFITKSQVESLDAHWRPVHLVCSPCHENFNFIGKIETYAQDSAVLADAFGWEKLVQNTNNNNERVKIQIESLVENNLKLAEIFQNSDCYQMSEIAKRLWRAFQINGYIHRNTNYPLVLLTDRGFLQKPIRVLLDVIFETIDAQTAVVKDDLKKQKRTMMLEAYATIPIVVMNKLKKIYKYDFELFQYDAEL